MRRPRRSNPRAGRAASLLAAGLAAFAMACVSPSVAPDEGPGAGGTSGQDGLGAGSAGNRSTGPGGRGGGSGGQAGQNPSGGADAGATSDPASRADGGGAPPPPSIPAPRVAISEIMYHPVLANGDENNHEFIEIHNPGAEPIALAGWKLSGEVQFTFPAGTTIAPRQFLVLAKNKTELLKVQKYGLTAAQVLGDYMGALDDGGGRIVLLDGAGATIDAVAYDDKFPWPLAADGLGAGDGWFEEPQWFAANDPRKSFTPHRYLGHSLERVSYTVAATEVSNWVPSPLDGPTPGKVSSVTGAPPAIVEQLVVGPESDPTARPIRASDKVVVRARFTNGAPITNVELELYVEFNGARKQAAPAAPMKLPMMPGPQGHLAIVPAMGERSLVRYRITGERRPGAREVIAPRPTDPIPYGHYAYYVSPMVAGKPYYEILISPENWGKMWSNISPSGAVLGCPSNYDGGCRMCAENPNWNGRVPAVFVFGGEPYDVRTRYHGSMEGRTFGKTVSNWPATAPGPAAGPSPLVALNWSVAFPRYKRFEGMGKLILNRLYQSCPGFSHVVAHAANESDLGGGKLPAPRVRRWARLFVNGGAYNYIMDIEPIGEDYLERFHGKGQPVGDVFKLHSASGDLGPYGSGAGAPITTNPSCPQYTVKYRYEKTYERNSNDWRTHDELIALVEGMAAAKAKGSADLRAFLDKNFDVDLTLKFLAIHQWGAPWDDVAKNFNIYKLPPQSRRAGKGPWVITTWDVDRTFGVFFFRENRTESPFESGARAAISVWCGAATGTVNQRLPRCNDWKLPFLTVFKTEYNAKLKELNETFFKPENLKKVIAEAAAAYDNAEADAMLSGTECNAATEVTRMQGFADRRYLSVKTQLGY